MPLKPLIVRITKSVSDLTGALQDEGRLPGLGLRRAARLPVSAALHSELNLPILLVTDRSDHALTLYDELGLWKPDTIRLYFPEPNPLFYENSPWGINTRRDRLVVLTSLASYHIPGVPIPDPAPLIIAPARAIMARTLPRRDFLKATHSLKTGQIAQPDELLRNWVALGYEPVSTVTTPGQVARRGGILDVWPPPDEQPTRVEFFGDEIDTLRHFDPATQRTVSRHGSPAQKRLLVTPAREYLLTHLDKAGILQQLDYKNREQGTSEQTTADEGQGISEFHLPLLHPAPASLLDYLPRQAIVLLDDWQDIRDTIQEVEEQAVGLRADYVTDGNLPADFPIPYLSLGEIEDSLAGHSSMELGQPADGGSDLSLSPEDGLSLSDRFTSGPRFGGRLKLLLDHLAERYSAGEQVFVVSRQAARLQELWQERSPRSLLTSSAPVFIEGSLAEGWTFIPPDGRSVHLLTDGEIFGWRRPEPRQRHRAVAEAPEAAYQDFQPKDWVVHIDHGIGRFGGLVRRTVDGIEREYLAVEYAEGDQLFVPVYQADRLTHYIGSDNRPPTITRLGSLEWRSVKARAREAVEEVAEDLLDLYAQRQVVIGHSFSNDTPWQQELEASFPYVETDDQLRVLRDVKADMENTRPMDRLICGDVGYGKTEVALRAAFKAVMDGMQVALLVPTTVLAQQHYHTFCERLAAFPVEVEMLSRFRTPQQQRDIIERLTQGGIDIVIGTHRLIQGDVQFKDLGLLVIDEEQRFGVTHKETLKQMRTEVDVLTLTATPIPRTLYMALTGVRDISTINTPPEERLPIITHVGPYSQRMVRQAILRELERGGQIFFVHNRVQTIQAMRSHLERLVPEARIAVAHGQMPENELSERMIQFTAGEVDVLLSTSIIESGLDIPNANTLIVDRADTFGLAQLYQLRGRVGRGAQRAYAYFFRHRRKLPTIDGRQRLETIAENTQLGAGYSIAMRDLEIRGAGDILGTRQHGHIQAIGFHLYTRLLSDAVHRLRQDRQLPPPDQPAYLIESRLPVNVDLPLSISIPPDYVADKSVRLRLYRRIADVRSLAEVDTLAEEFHDRFGPLPEEVKNLLYQLKVKITAEKAGLASVSNENGQIVLRYPPLPEGLSNRAIPDPGPDVRRGKNALWMPYKQLSDWPGRLLEVTQALAGENQAVRV